VGSLPVELTSEELREHFKSCGSVVDCKVVCDDGAPIAPSLERRALKWWKGVKGGNN